MYNYIQVYGKPHHITLQRIIANAGPDERVELGENHRDLRLRVLRKVPDSNPRTHNAARAEAVKEALRLHSIAEADGHSMGLSVTDYEAMLRSALQYLDAGQDR
jgi:hypothetical protein